MSKIRLYDGRGQESGTLDAPAALSNAKAKVTLVHQVAVAELAGRRQGNASTLDRTEVKGSGVKIRRQKGTGRSRQGDKRVPHMRGGGVSHGPKPRDYHQNTPRKMRQSAFRTALNSRLQNDVLFVIDGLQMAAPKTKEFLALLGRMGLVGRKLLLLTSEAETTITLSARNLPKVTVQSVSQTSLVDVLGSEVVLCTRTAWSELEARVGGSQNDGAANGSATNGTEEVAV
jgi:large subunit ribosomal protein L4